MRWLCVLAAAACARASPAGPLADRVVASKSLDEVKMMLTELEVDYAAYGDHEGHVRRGAGNQRPKVPKVLPDDNIDTVPIFNPHTTTTQERKGAAALGSLSFSLAPGARRRTKGLGEASSW